LATKTAPTLVDVEAARGRVLGHARATPVYGSETLSRRAGRKVWLKAENLQRTGSFKVRGAVNKLSLLGAEERAAGVIAASAGNHGQAVAWAARELGVKATVFMPQDAPMAKVEATRNYGAATVLAGAGFDEALAAATDRARETGATFVHAFEDEAVIAGQGTIGLELLEQIPQLEAVVVPIGGGGLIGGIACAIKESRPEVRIVGVQTSRLPSMAAAIEQHHPVTIPSATTIADGIAVRRAGEVNFPVVERYVDEIVTVDEDEIASAILMLLEREKTLAEGAGATALAALLQHKTSLQGAHTAVLIGGGNIDVTLLARIIERGLVQDGRLIRLRIHLLDKPGALAELTRLIAHHRANIVDTLYNRAYYGVNLGDTVIDITMETRGREQVAELLAALTEGGYKHNRVL